MRARSGVVALTVVALVLAPLTAVPLFLVGQHVADALDDDKSNGVLALGLLLGIGGPAALTSVVSWRRARRSIALALGLTSGAASVAVLFAAFLVYCSAVDCVV
jgi:ABC-type Fe3+ transport system permease subunit